MTLIKTKPLTAETLQSILEGDRRREEAKYVRFDIFYSHGFPRNQVALLEGEYDYDKLFKPYVSEFGAEECNHYHVCICKALVKNCESHFNWHKRELT